ncbi:hypothetical protein HYU19_03320 [Candidatus Woesearchaeota archaeon]|nr:hypothetical protein [Candidatus Woesearchaeota archaeon]
MAHSRRPATATPAILKAGLVLIILLIGTVITLRLIQVPYDVTEAYETVEEYQAEESYVANETQLVRVPVVSEELYLEEKNVQLGSPSDLLDPTASSFPGGSSCIFADFNYTVEYIQSTPLEENKYDPVTEIGYNGKDNKLRQGVEICNQEPKRMIGNFRICKWAGDNLDNCIDRLQLRVRPRSCEKRVIAWVTMFDEEKHMTLEQIQVSTKLLCKDSSGEYSAATYDPTTLDSEALEDLTSEEPPHMLTGSGTYHPSAYPYRGVLIDDSVTSAVQKTKATRTVTTYQDQEKLVEVEKTRSVPQTRVIQHQRVVTKYRSLFDDLLAAYLPESS